MYQIYKGAKHGLSLRKLKVFALDKYTEEEMFIIRHLLEQGYSEYDIDFDKIVNMKSTYMDDISDIKKLTLR